MPRIVTTHTLASLLRHEARVLLQNRVACALLLAILLVAAAAQWGFENAAHAPRDTCYVVYWQRDGLIPWLESAAVAAGNERGLRIEIAPVERLTGSDNVIRYPNGSHSIQIRPLSGTAARRRGRLIWYWYSGGDPAVLLPYVEWFQSAAHEYFSDGEPLEVCTSPLGQQLALPAGNHVHLDFHHLLAPQFVRPALVWIAVYFAALYLSTLSLAQSIAERTLLSLAVTPAGWHGAAAGRRIFYAFLGLLLATCVAAVVSPSSLRAASFWITLTLAAICYVGVGETIGSWCGSVASAGMGAMLYLVLSSVLYAGAWSLAQCGGPSLAAFTSAETAIVHALHEAARAEGELFDFSTCVPLFCWVVLWYCAGVLSYRHVTQTAAC